MMDEEPGSRTQEPPNRDHWFRLSELRLAFAFLGDALTHLREADPKDCGRWSRYVEVCTVHLLENVKTLCESRHKTGTES